MESMSNGDCVDNSGTVECFCYDGVGDDCSLSRGVTAYLLVFFVYNCGAAEATGLCFVGVMGCGKRLAWAYLLCCYQPSLLSASRVDLGFFVS